MCEPNTKLNGKVAIVTGGTSGIGYEAAKKLANLGARVIIASRNEDHLQEAVRSIKDDTGNQDIAYRRVDFASLKSVRNFVDRTLFTEPQLDILVNNVGAVGLKDELTADGLNSMMQVNYFSTFLLTYLLIPLLKSSQPSRILTVSAGSMFIGTIDFEHMNDVGYWSTISLLSNAKLAEALFSVQLAKELKDTQVVANTWDPFIASGTGILGNFPGFFKVISNQVLSIFARSKETVGSELAYFAAEPQYGNVRGQNFKFCSTWFNTHLVNDEKLLKKLWDYSKMMVHITDDEDWEKSENDVYFEKFKF